MDVVGDTQIRCFDVLVVACCVLTPSFLHHDLNQPRALWGGNGNAGQLESSIFCEVVERRI